MTRAAHEPDPVPACPHCGATSTQGRQTVGIQEAAELTGYSVRQVARIAGPEVEGQPAPKIRVLAEAAGARKLSLPDVLSLRKRRLARANRRRPAGPEVGPGE